MKKKRKKKTHTTKNKSNDILTIRYNDIVYRHIFMNERLQSSWMSCVSKKQGHNKNAFDCQYIKQSDLTTRSS